MYKNIKILVGYHKPAQLLKDDIFVPIHLGRSVSVLSEEDNNWMHEHMIGDNTGDNISDKNQMLNEMTAIYWAWKNYKKLGSPDYIGFMHYRRHLKADASDNTDLIMCEVCDEDYEKKLNINNLKKLILQNDFIINNKSVWKNFTVRSQYKNAPYHHIEDLNLMEQLIKQTSMHDYMTQYFDGDSFYFCNIFVMKRELFFEYCEFIFPILLKMCSLIDYKGRSIEESRAYFSERLTGVFLTCLKTRKNIKYIELPMTLVQNTELYLKPMCEKEISITTAITENYFYILCVWLRSIIEHTNKKRKYHIYVMIDKIASYKREALLHMCPNNVYIDFVFMDRYTNKYVTKDNKFSYHIGLYYNIATYYRSFITDIFKNFSKVLYMDADTLALCDVASLYDRKLGNHYVAATSDLFMQLWTSMDDNMKLYVQKNLMVKNVKKYFQGGVVLFNIQKLLSINFLDKCFSVMKNLEKPLLHDQDILNAVCYGNVLYLDNAYNVDVNIDSYETDHKDFWSNAVTDSFKSNYVKLKNTAKIFHYAGPNKPWNLSKLEYNCKFYFNLWWNVARKTMFYEHILQQYEAHLQPREILSKIIKLYWYKLLKHVTFGKIRTRCTKHYESYLTIKIPYKTS